MSSCHDETLIRLFDLLQESLGDARRLVGAGDTVGAMRCLDRFARDRLRAQPFPDPVDWDAEKRQADLLLDRHLLLPPVHREPFALATPVDWRKRYEEDECWNGHMGFFYGFTPLARLYGRTGDERYAAAWCEYVGEFLDAVGYRTPTLSYFPSRPMALNDRKSCDNGECDHASPGHWISLSAASRSDQWLEGCRWLADSPHLTEEFLARILRSLYEDHWLCLVNNPRSNTPNQYFHTSTALLRLAQAIPEARNASAAFLIAHARLCDAIATQVYPDGTDIEQSPNYNPNTTKHIKAILAMLADAPESRKSAFRDAARRRVRYIAQAVTPDLGMIDLAKAHHADNYRTLLLEQGRLFGVPEAVWLATEGREGSAPTYRSVAMPYSGFYVLRSGFEPTAEYVFFKASPRPAGGHMHEDNLSFILAAGDRLLLVDSGNFSYTGNTPLDRAMNAYSDHTLSHSTVCVDGQGQSRRIAMQRDRPDPYEVPSVSARGARKLANRCLAGARFEYVEGDYADGYGPDNALRVRHARRILWVKGRGWLVIDLLDPPDAQEHAYTQAWMLGPDFAGHCALRGDTATTTAPGTNLRLHLLQPHAFAAQVLCGQDEPPCGWYTVHYGQRVPKPDVHVTWRGTGRQLVATWVQTDATPAVRSQLAHLAGGRLRVRIEFGDDASLEADVGSDAAPLVLDSLRVTADFGVLFSGPDGRHAALLGVAGQAGEPRGSHHELDEGDSGWRWAAWPAMTELDAVNDATTGKD